MASGTLTNLGDTVPAVVTQPLMTVAVSGTYTGGTIAFDLGDGSAWSQTLAYAIEGGPAVQIVALTANQSRTLLVPCGQAPEVRVRAVTAMGGNCAVSITGAAGGGGAITVADGANVSQGAKADAAATDSTSSWSLVAILKGLWSLLAGVLKIGGDVAAGAADSGNPVKAGLVAQSASPAAVAAGQRVNALGNLRGAVALCLARTSAGTGSDAQALGFMSALDDTPVVQGAAPFLSNGLNWDKQRSNTDLSLLASAARTATTASADQTNYNGSGKVRIILSVTAASGTGGLQVVIKGKDSISGNYYALNATPTAVLAPGVFVYDIDPQGSVAANGVTQVTKTFVPRTWRVEVLAGDASSYTYSISAVTMVN